MRFDRRKQDLPSSKTWPSWAVSKRRGSYVSIKRDNPNSLKAFFKHFSLQRNPVEYKLYNFTVILNTVQLGIATVGQSCINFCRRMKCLLLWATCPCRVDSHQSQKLKESMNLRILYHKLVTTSTYLTEHSTVFVGGYAIHFPVSSDSLVLPGGFAIEHFEVKATISTWASNSLMHIWLFLCSVK